jgi:uncharacterized protein YabN with tetrapyrrole methylase and pyrophosphatase domain
VFNPKTTAIMINELAKKIHAEAKEKGFWDRQMEKPAVLMMVITELSEAVEADREGRKIDADALDVLSDDCWIEFTTMSRSIYRSKIKDTFEAELCDALMRLLDAMAFYNVDADRIIKNAIEYNKLRPSKNGKKY